MSGSASRAGDVPVDIGRDEAREAARTELADPAYADAEPSWPEQAAEWLVERIEDVITTVSGVSPGGVLGLVILLALLVVVAVVVRLRVGGLARAYRSGGGPVLDGRTATAAEHRDAAETAIAAGDVGTAVVERFRAIVRELEQRGVLDEQRGRTADEVAAQAGVVLPASADGLRAAARAFDDVYYGDRPATVEVYRMLADVDLDVQSVRRIPAGASV